MYVSELLLLVSLSRRDARETFEEEEEDEREGEGEEESNTRPNRGTRCR